MAFMLKRRWRDEDDDAERVDKLLVSSLKTVEGRSVLSRGGKASGKEETSTTTR